MDTERRDELYVKAIVTLLVVFPFAAVATAIALLWNTYVFASDMVLLAVFFFPAMIGVTLGFHRLLTHRSFETKPWIKAMLLIFGCMAFEAGPAQWTAIHIKHHAHSDEDDDPHSPLAGFWHAHMGWLFQKRSYVSIKTYAPHLLDDSIAMTIEKYWYAFAFAGLFLPLIIGGPTGFIWAGGVRMFLNTHLTYSVNSICHTFGRRDYQTNDESRNNWVVGLLALGEGWHNNHHAFPESAFHGLQWWQFDVSGMIVRMLESMGLAWNVQRVAPELQELQKTRTQMMMDALRELRSTVLTSISSARSDIAALGSRIRESYPQAQIDQWMKLQRQSLAKLDSLFQSAEHAVHAKRQKLLQYQREAEQTLVACRDALSRIAGEWVTA